MTESEELSKDEPESLPRLPRWIWPVYVFFLVLLVPWYIPSDSLQGRVWAFPVWAFIILAGAIGMAAFTAYVFLRLWKDEGQS